jgi:hypothetical protein
MTLKIHELTKEMMQLNPDEPVWQHKSAVEWYPPPDFTVYIPS